MNEMYPVFIAAFGSTGLGSPIGIGSACPAEGHQGSVAVEPEGVSLYIAVYFIHALVSKY